MICNKEHRFLEDFKQLPDSQGGELRHKCAGCAFERGFWDAICWKSMANPSELESKLPDSQAGTVRHKDAYEAYKHGYKKGQFIKYFILAVFLVIVLLFVFK